LNSRIIITIGVLFALAGCKAHKQVLATKPTQQQEPKLTVSGPGKGPVIHTVDARLTSIQSRQTTFNTFSGKAKSRLDVDGSANDVTLNVRIQRDKKIWVSVVATVVFNIEVARAVITPDSIIIINKLQGVYLKKPFSYIYQYAGNQVTFQSVQALLVGNAIPELLNDKTYFAIEDANTIASGSLQDLMYRMVIGADFKVSQTSVENHPAQLSMQVSNSAFIQADGRAMPSQIDIVSSAGSKKINASLHYINAEFDKPVDMTFSIPERYTPAN